MLTKLYFGADLPTWALFLELAVAGLVVIWSGSRLTRLADALAEHLNLGGAWIGLILLATVTSLPELIIGGTAVWIDNVDLAMGGILGSCAFNVMIVVLLNALVGGGSVLGRVSTAHTLSSSFGILLIGMAMFGIVLKDKLAALPLAVRVVEIAWAGLIAVTYLGCMKLSYRFERRRLPQIEVPGEELAAGPKGLYTGVAILAAIIVAASWWLARCGDVLSTHEIEALGRPLGATFVGACFLAVATSLPEIATSIAAARLGSLDLALGNIFGSNMFNIFVIPFLEVVARIRGRWLFTPADSINTVQSLTTGLIAVLLTAIAVGGLTYRSERQMFRRFGFDSVMIAVTYAGGMLLLLIEG